MKTRIKLGTQVEQSTTPYSVPYTNNTNNLIYSAGADTSISKILYFDAATYTLKWLAVGTQLSISGDTLNASAGAGGYATIQEEGTALTARSVINFVGTGVTAADDSANNRTNVTLDADLNNIASLTTTGIAVRNNTGSAWLTRSIAGTTNRISITNADGVSGNPTIDIDVNYAGQASITTLGTISTGTWNANVIPKAKLDANIAYKNEANIFTQLGNTFDHPITIGAPALSNHAATKLYVDNAVQGLAFKDAARVATTGNLTATWSNSNSGQFTGAPTTIDGIAIATGDRILVKNQTTASQNGIYEVQTPASTWFRAPDANLAIELGSAFIFVEEGGTQADTAWVTTFNSNQVLNTANIPWVQFTSVSDIVAGNGITKTGNTISVNPANNGGIAVGSTGVSLTDTNVTANSYGSATQVATFTVDAKGRLTAAANVAIQIPVSAVTDFFEAIQDNIGGAVGSPGTGFLRVGLGLSKVYDDTGDTLTLALSHLGIQNLVDPNVDRIMFWDDSAGKMEWLTLGTGFSIGGTGNTTLNYTPAWETNAVTSIIVKDSVGAQTWSSQDTADIKTGEFVFVEGTQMDLEVATSTSGIIKYIRFGHGTINTATGYTNGGANVFSNIAVSNGHITSVTSRTLTLDDFFVAGESATGIVESILLIEPASIINAGVAIAYATTSTTGLTNVTKNLAGVDTRYNTKFDTFTEGANKIKVYKNGMLLARTQGITRDYSINLTAGTITFEDAIETTDRVTLIVTDYKVRFN